MREYIVEPSKLFWLESRQCLAFPVLLESMDYVVKIGEEILLNGEVHTLVGMSSCWQSKIDGHLSYVDLLVKGVE